MAINITRVTVHILDKTSPNTGQCAALYGRKYERYLRWKDPKLMFSPIWYGIQDNGELSGISYNHKELEQEFKESGGFLEQLELF